MYDFGGKTLVVQNNNEITEGPSLMQTVVKLYIALLSYVVWPKGFNVHWWLRTAEKNVCFSLKFHVKWTYILLLLSIFSVQGKYSCHVSMKLILVPPAYFNIHNITYLSLAQTKSKRECRGIIVAHNIAIWAVVAQAKRKIC